MGHTAEIVLRTIGDLAIVGALGYVIKLMREQIALLHQENPVKQSQIEAHKATIEQLTRFQAPAIARDLEQMTKTAENYAIQKAELEKQMELLAKAASTLADGEREKLAELLAKQNASITKTMNMAFNVGVSAGSYEAAAALTISIGYIRAMSDLAGEKELSPGLKSVLDDLERKLDHFGKLADQALRGEKAEFKFTSQFMEAYKSLKDKRPSTGFSTLKEGEDD